jgi:hypothetical protein
VCSAAEAEGFALDRSPEAVQPKGYTNIIMVEKNCSSARPACGPPDEGMTMTTNRKDSTSQPRRGRKSASKSTSPSTTKKGTAARKRAQPKATAASRSTKSQAVPAKARSTAGSRTAAGSTSRASRSTTQARSTSRSQASLLNPMAWLSSLETTLTSPQARVVMAEALRAVANVLEKPQSSEQGQGGGAQQGRDAVSAAGSLGAEIVAAPLEVAAAAIGAAGEVVTSALGGSPREGGGTGTGRKVGRRSSSSRKSSAGGD